MSGRGYVVKALHLAVLTATLLAPSTPFEPEAHAQAGRGRVGVRVYVIDIHQSSGPATVVGVAVATGPTSYTDASSTVWAANSLYWFWDTGSAFPTGNPGGDDGFRLSVAVDQGDITDYEPGDADFVYDNDPFETFSDDVGIMGGTKRFKIWSVPNSGSPELIGYLKEFEPSYDLSWFGFESQVSEEGYFELEVGDSHWWFEPTTGTFNEDDIGVWDHEPR